MVILGIETSCDETAVSVIEANGDLNSFDFKVLGSAVNSQIKIHEEFGGVVPNLAKREHQKNLPLVLAQALKEAGFGDELWGIPKQDESATGQVNYELWKEKNKNNKFPIDLIVVTVGPGLEPALWVGIEFAKELSEKWGVPLIGANHMEGHIASVLINKTEEFSISNSQFSKKEIGFPAIALLISGGHTELIYLKNWLEKEKIGETKDDAVGEAFDKVARMLGLPYPGGPQISRLAEEARTQKISLPTKLPRPMLHSRDFNFSFSGLKTAVLYYLRNLKNSYSPQAQKCTDISLLENSSCSPQSGSQGISELADSKNFSKEILLSVAREFEDAVIETLVTKTKMAIEKYDPKTLIIGGGVIANKALRENFLKLNETYPQLQILIPEKSLTTDNATMIAAAGFIENLKHATPKELRAQGNLSIN